MVAQAWTVGQVAPLSGAEATQGRAYVQGMKLYFDHVNKAGGVQGQPVELAVLDDLGHPDETVSKTRQLLAQSKPVVLAGYFGNRNLSALLDSKALDGSALVVDTDKSKMINVLLHGQNNGAMPAWKQLSDTELAAVMTYTKNNWSNQTQRLVQPAEVLAARQ